MWSISGVSNIFDRHDVKSNIFIKTGAKVTLCRRLGDQAVEDIASNLRFSELGSQKTRPLKQDVFRVAAAAIWAFPWQSKIRLSSKKPWARSQSQRVIWIIMIAQAVNGRAIAWLTEAQDIQSLVLFCLMSHFELHLGAWQGVTREAVASESSASGGSVLSCLESDSNFSKHANQRLMVSHWRVLMTKMSWLRWHGVSQIWACACIQVQLQLELEYSDKSYSTFVPYATTCSVTRPYWKDTDQNQWVGKFHAHSCRIFLQTLGLSLASGVPLFQLENGNAI